MYQNCSKMYEIQSGIKTGEWIVCLTRLDERICLNQAVTSYVYIVSSGYLGTKFNASQGRISGYNFNENKSHIFL
jgi:hypothetical protein